MKYLIFACLMVVAVFGCQKIEDVAQPNQESTITMRSGLDTASIDSTFIPACVDMEDLFSRISKSNGVLEFDSIAHFENCVKCLEELLEAHLAEFDSTYAAYTPEERDSIEEAINFSYFEPLEDFEDDLQFDSRRKMIESQIITWLNQSNPVFDKANDPDEQDDLSEVERTLLNEDGEVIIHGTLIDLTDVASVSSVSCFPFIGDGCKRFEKSTGFWTYPTDNDKRIKGKLVNRAYPWKIKIDGKVVNYKKRGNGWKRARTNLYTYVVGRFADSSCGTQNNVAAWKGPKKRKQLSSQYTYWGLETWAKHVCERQFGYYEVVDDNFYRYLEH